jgi:hypothetical protein
MKKTPLAIFAYNRPDHLRRTFESLQLCTRLDECEVFIFSDGPKIPADDIAVQGTRDVIHEWAEKFNGKVIKQPVNIGLARSIVNGVTKLCDEYGRVIVLEDDMLTSPRFLDYMLTTLDRYQDEEKLCQISGYMFPVRHPQEPDAFFLPITTTWGWATWGRAWKIFQWDISTALIELKDPAVQHAFDLGGVYPYSKMMEDCAAGRNDSWGIRWWWSVFKAQKLALHPRHSLVWVGGFDGSGTNNEVNERLMSISMQDILSFPWRETFEFQSELKIDTAALDKIKKYLKTLARLSFGSRLKMKIKMLLGKEA